MSGIAKLGLNLAFPGSGTAIELLRKFGPYLLIVLAAVGAYWWADERGRAAQKAKDQARITYLTGARDGWRQNAVATKAALDQQSAAVRATAKAADDKVAASHTAAMAAQKRAQASQGLIDRLTASAAQPRAQGQDCTVSAATEEAWPDAQ